MRYFNFFVAIFLSILYATAKIPPTEKYNLWITSFVIPAALAGNLVLVLVSLALRKKSTLYYLIALAIGSPFLVATYGTKHLLNRSPSSDSSFYVMNYNLGGFHMRPYVYRNTDSARLALKNLLLDSSADIKCFQEFTNFPWSKEFNVIAQLDAAGSYYYFSKEEAPSDASYSTTGTLIISKFPILSSGDVLASDNGFNRIAYADVLLGTDTIRIINVHLESMGLTRFNHRTTNLRAVKQTTKTIIGKLKTGVFERSKQIKQLRAFVLSSPYRVICVGDFNELPYSYAYQFLRKKMKNTFEESGRGFGFTYHGATLSMLRIDNQFYSGALRSIGFQTLDHIKFSDHFPIQGEYQIVHEIHTP